MLAVPIVVDAGGASAVIAPSPVRISFRGPDGRTVLAQVANRRPSPLTEPTTVDPEPQGVDAEPGDDALLPAHVHGRRRSASSSSPAAGRSWAT